MKVKFKHKVTGQEVVVENTGAVSNAEIKVTSDDPTLTILFTSKLRTNPDINILSVDEKRFINSETRIMEMFSDEYLKEIAIPYFTEFFDVDVLEA